ncbi:MAG: hypothetical protein ACW977_09800 [Candidatus Thorarchaeota archaeon]
MKRYPRPRRLFIVGLLITISSVFLPFRAPIWTNHYSNELGLGIEGVPDSVDIPLTIFPGDSVAVTVDDSAIERYCDIYILINYQYPTKFVSEAAYRFSSQSEISCVVSWGDVRLIPVLVTGFVLRIFYSGSNLIQAETTITNHANVITYGGVSTLLLSITLALIPQVRSKLKNTTELE